MSLNTLPRLHPRTGARFTPLGYRKNGAPIWPILGGSEPPNQPDITTRPEGVAQDEWDALADPGKRAVVRERTARAEAETARASEKQAREAAEQALAAAKAAGTKTDPPKGGGQTGDPGDVAEQIRLGIETAMAPYRERDQQREAAEAAQKVRDAVTQAAGERFHDAGDAVAQLDLTTLIDSQGRADTAKVDDALTKLLERKPYLGKAVDSRRRASDGSLIGGSGGGTASLEDRVKAQLALMKNASGQ